MGWVADQRAYEQGYYGGYCNQVRDFGLEPIPYYQFVEELRTLLSQGLSKKERSKELIEVTIQYWRRNNG